MIPEPARPLTPEEQEAVAVGVEPEGIAARSIIQMALGGFIFLSLIITAVIYWIKVTEHNQEVLVANTAQAPLLRQVNADAERMLTQYGVVDAEQGVYRIPIDRAMDLMLQETQTP